MLVIDLPETYENSIVLTQVQVQLKETKKFEQQARTLRESINVDISEADKNVTVINAEAGAKAITVLNEAQAKTINNTIFYEQKAYQDTSSLLGVNANSGLLDYMYYTNVMKLEQAELLVGLENSLININAGGRREISQVSPSQFVSGTQDDL